MFEDPEKSDYDFAKHPEDYRDGLIGGIGGFEMEIELLEGKFKLGQERSEADRQGVLQKLRSERPGRSIYQFTSEFYKRSKPSAE